MSKIKDKMIADLRATIGTSTDPAVVVECLYQHGVIDDVLCRRYVVRQEFTRIYGTTSHSARRICEDIGEEHGLTHQGVHKILRSGPVK